MNAKIRNCEKTYTVNVALAEAVFAKNKSLDQMTIKELTTICKPLKRKEDGKMPIKKNELIAKFHEWNGRPKPNFNIVDIDEVSSSNNDDNNERVNDYEIENL